VKTICHQLDPETQKVSEGLFQRQHPIHRRPMNLSYLKRMVWALVAVPLALAGSFAHAANAVVRDQAGFFSESAESAASRVISEIQTTLKRDMVVETFRDIPAEVRRGVDLQDKAAVNKLFETWSVDRARELGVQGVYVLLTREPAHLQVAVGNQTQRQAFTMADRNALANRMLEQLRAKKYDDALIAGVGFVRDTLTAHAAPSTKTKSPSTTSTTSTTSTPFTHAPVGVPSEAPSRGGSIWSMLLPILLIGVVVLVVIRILGRLFGRGGAGGMQPGFGGGGGFLRSMLGGIFGAAAGMWLFNQFSGLGNAFGSDASSAPQEGGADDAGGQDTDYSSSGGDFGDSGGGDSGGGDF
jgi:uncharacterized protein